MQHGAQEEKRQHGDQNRNWTKTDGVGGSQRTIKTELCQLTFYLQPTTGSGKGEETLSVFFFLPVLAFVPIIHTSGLQSALYNSAIFLVITVPGAGLETKSLVIIQPAFLGIGAVCLWILFIFFKPGK